MARQNGETCCGYEAAAAICEESISVMTETVCGRMERSHPAESQERGM
jgi:hypothetical protein